jgi:CTP:molybdopterin cytidylyltransferase MocA
MRQGNETLHVLVLAAGAARRFGSPKQLAHLNGEPLLRRAIARASKVQAQAVTVVLGAHAAQLAPLLRHSSASLVINRDWERGLASSLRAGIASLPASCEAVLILLADQVAVTADDLARLTAVWRAQPQLLAAAHYAGRAGGPAVFPRWCFAEVETLRGDTGARSLLERHADRTLRIPMPNAAIDIDTPEDLQVLTALQ